MPPLGAHMSAAGGAHRAVERAAELGMQCVQLFSKNNNQWRAKPLTENDASAFRDALENHRIGHPIVHDSYLINLGSPDDALWTKSIEALAVELERANLLGIGDVIAHPGAHVGSGEEAGLERIAAGLDRVFGLTSGLTTRVALEITAGQGSNLGYRFEHLATIIDRCGQPERLSVCLDTCHLLAAGYPLSPEKSFDATFKDFERTLGFDRLVAVHLNDSKKGLGSRVDRHEHIGRGEVGLEAFALILRDRRFAKVPMYLETPKEDDPETGRPWDELNLETLRTLAKPAAKRKTPPRKTSR